MREREEHFYSNIIKLCLDIISTASVPPPTVQFSLVEMHFQVILAVSPGKRMF